MFVAYVGKLMLDGSIHLDKAAFWSNEVDSDELKMRERDEPLIAPADPAHKATATLAIGSGKPMMLAGSDDLRTRVSEIGRKLVPEYQKALPASDPTKINFRFYVVHDKRKMVLDALNGTILIPDTLLRTVRNEAQLAALLSVAVAQVVEKQELQSRHRRRLQQVSGWLLTGVGAIPTPFALFALPAQIANSTTYKNYVLAMTQQAGRIGLEYMIASGYDPREAPEAWKVTLQKHPEKSDKLPELGTFVQTELETTYWKSDFKGLRVGAEFGEWSKELN
jgi:predicted Zn-dependent protease